MDQFGAVYGRLAIEILRIRTEYTFYGSFYHASRQHCEELGRRLQGPHHVFWAPFRSPDIESNADLMGMLDLLADQREDVGDALAAIAIRTVAAFGDRAGLDVADARKLLASAKTEAETAGANWRLVDQARFEGSVARQTSITNSVGIIALPVDRDLRIMPETDPELEPAAAFRIQQRLRL